ncbi:Innexin family-containing protein [Aphelenchoides besseyi]|nr:Innexin family-containing protein [Aphelenchoides besseyi]
MMIFRTMHAVPYSNQEPVKDVIANLHSYFTCNMLIALAVLLSYKQFGGRPIECMLPLTGVSFSRTWEEYSESICWSEDTYYVSFNDTVESFSPAQRREKRISYYQWIPFFLLFQAACFKFPTLIWRYFAGQSGMRVGEVLRFATNEANTEPATRSSNIYALRVHLQGALKFQYRLTRRKLTPHKILRFLNFKYASYYVAMIYLISKACFLANVLIQIDLLNRYLVPNASKLFGFYAWRDLWYGNRTWEESGLFPRVTLCDFVVREMGQTQTHTVQCVLLLNVLTEKAFILLWAWYNALALVTLYNFTLWIFSLLNPRSSQHFIFNHLEMHGGRLFANESTKGLNEVQIQVERFINKYLKMDGMFILRLIAQHADIVFTTELVAQLWLEHYRIEKQREEIRLTDKKWHEHLKRFKAIDDRLHSSMDLENMDTPQKSDKLSNFEPQYQRGRTPRQSIIPSSPPRVKRTYSDDEIIFASPPKSMLNSDDSDDDQNSMSEGYGRRNHSSPKKNGKS